MFNKEQAKEMLRGYVWDDGKVFPLLEGPYRYRIMVHCTKLGRQRAQFANGTHPYFCYLELIAGSGDPIRGGASIVPVLPNGKLIMVVEQRPAQYVYHSPINPKINGVEVDLGQYGPYSSLEFPGGAIDPGKSVKSALLQELFEETGVVEQTAICYTRVPPIHVSGSEIIGGQFLSVVFLSSSIHADHVETDGGLQVFAMTGGMVQENIWRGAIRSGAAALLQWDFYREVVGMLANPQHQEFLQQIGYLAIEKVKIVKV